MCGIAGIFSTDGLDNQAATITRMTEILAHRGPDGDGIWSSAKNHVHFGHRRLSILDLSDSAAQPMQALDRYVLVFNGEIYNFEELRRQCEAKGSQFLSNGDSEVIIHMIHHFGADAVKQFRGMWAFVLYDKQEDTILLSRDPFGIKPLYCATDQNKFYFASEIKALRLINEKFNQPDETTIDLFKDHAFLDIGPWTFFNHVKRFPARHNAVIDLKKSLDMQITDYWQPTPEINHSITEKQAADQFVHLLSESVKRHMRSDVPIAFCLSGGLDSSSIVALAKPLAAQKQQLKSFTTHYPDHPEIDETAWAQMVIDRYDCDSVFVQPDYKTFKDSFDKVLYHHDEPFGSTSIFAQTAIAKAIHQNKIKVVLEGQGADEALAGYASHIWAYLSNLKHQGAYGHLIAEILGLVRQRPRLVWDKKRALYQRLIKFRAAKKSAPTEIIERLEWLQSDHNFSHDLHRSTFTFPLPSFLRNVDRSTMMHSLESRVPFLDVDLYEFLTSLPPAMKIKDGVTKYILRQAMKDHLPEKIINRMDKLGFPAPEQSWMKQAFSVDLNGHNSLQWRQFIIQKWRDMVIQNNQIDNSDTGQNENIDVAK